ncbi:MULTISPECIES: non-ribosomal peptide synthetase [unclassified Xanthomonas]|uniref:non-ribosomal peptide synthetase n=1 Tax=unclassified Xanthomonas TaxID=2643310 RepID=UPI002A82B7ED|nr:MULTISPECIES: non-ribosomal peptide synthetase [unclassified Xanthomonas]MDY4298101.1 non-ribosomal peptide synthetase [Xanthomonas sp. LF02-5]MDY4359832.1 non-ribosomal peptide synthetase [Xanthomonas sp. LF04-12]
MPSTTHRDAAQAASLAPASSGHAHALRVRLAAGVCPEQARQRAVAFACTPEWSTCGAAPVLHFFSENLPFADHTARADALAKRELARAFGAGPANMVRVVQLTYANGPCDLIVAARRDVAGLPTLTRIVDHLASGVADAAPALGGGISAVSAAVLPPITDTALGEEPLARWPAATTETGTTRHGPIVLNAPLEVIAKAITRVVLAFARQAIARIPVLADVPRAQPGDTAAGWTRRVIGADPQHCGGLLTRAVAAPSDAGTRTVPGQEPGDWLGVVVHEMPALSALDGTQLDYLLFLQPPYPVMLEVAMTEAGSEIRLSHERSILGDDDARWLLTCIDTVARQLLVNPAAALDSLPLLDEAQLRGVLALGAGAERPQTEPPLRIEAGIATFAARQPQAPAISDDAGTMTYRELQACATTMAAHLARLGVRAGDHVGLCVDRSRHMIAAAVAIMKLGGTYVPIDPKYPADRIAHTCADAAVTLLIVQNAASARPADCAIATLPALLDADTGGGLQEPDSLTPDDAAYIIYTSGSTGHPKGVRIAHRSVHALIAAVRDDFRLEPQDVWSFFHSFSFDFSVWEVWGALLTGACVHVVGYEASRDPVVLIDQINDRGITVLSQTPSAFAQLMAHEAHRPIGPQLRLVIFGGETLDTRRLLPWFDRHPEQQCRLVNMFGITETTVHVTARTVSRLDALEGSRSVGKPIPGWQAYVLSADLALLPPGVDGEIHVAGAGVALGYHDRAELSAQRFLANPFGAGRLYRSGDRGRLLPDGELLHLGRLDNQIKLRGFRIELDEIRSVLQDCPGVASAAVLFAQRDPADAATARIDAYVVLDGATLDQVWDLALSRLPEHMLPAAIAQVSSIPLTINGKADPVSMAAQVLASSGRGLRTGGERPAPAPAAAIDRPVDAAAAADNVTRQLLDIWRELFAVPVSSSDNFFDLGGNSLIAIRMSAKARERGLPGLQLRDLYVHQTIAGLSAFLAASAPARTNGLAERAA